jgi:hypothetical protein
MKPLRQESFSVFSFFSKTMHDLTCSQEFLGIQSLVQKTEIILMFVQKKWILEIQVIP